MPNELKHYGILRMKWGVRRYQNLDGTLTPEGVIRYRKGKNSLDDLTDEQLRQRINRLKLEEEYENLEAKQRNRHTSGVKKALSDAFQQFGTGLLEKSVTKALATMFDREKEDSFDIGYWRNADVNSMDEKTIKRVSKWYNTAKEITSARELLSKANKTQAKDDKQKQPKTETKTQKNKEKEIKPKDDFKYKPSGRNPDDLSKYGPYEGSKQALDLLYRSKSRK